MKISIAQKIISLTLATVVFFTSLGIDPSFPVQTNSTHRTPETDYSNQCLAPYARAVTHIMYQNNKLRFENKIRTLAPIGLSVAEATFIGTSVIISATLGPQFAILALLPRIAWNTAITLHGLGHTLAGAGAIFAGQIKKSPFSTAFAKAAAFVNINHITENVGLNRFLKSLVPLPFLVPLLGFDKTGPPADKNNPIGVPVVKQAGRTGVKIQALAGMAVNAAVSLLGSGILLGGLLNLIPLSTPAALAVIPFIVANTIAFFASSQDVHIFFKGPGNLLLMSNLLGTQVKKKHYKKDKKSVKALFSSQIKFFPSGWEGQSIGIMLSSAGYFFVQTLKDMGRFELVNTIRRWGFWYANTSIRILRTIKRAGKTPQADYMSFLMHLSSKESKDAPDEIIQPIATEKNVPAKKWTFDGKTLKANEMLWTNYIVHSGHYTGTKLFGTLRGVEQVRWYLQNVLNLDNVPAGDSLAVSMLMDLYTTQGNWSKSLRLAYQQMKTSNFEKAFPHGIIKSPAVKKTHKGIGSWIRRIFASSTLLPKTIHYTPSSGAPNNQVLAVWEQVFDTTFEKFAKRYSNRMCQTPTKPALHEISPAYQEKLHTALVSAVLSSPSLKRLFNKAQADEFVRKALKNFMHNDTFKATRMVMKKSTGSFGLFTGSTSELGNVLTAVDKPLSVGLGGTSLSNIQRRGWSSHADMLKLLQDNNDPVYRWIYRLNDIDGEIVKLGKNFEDIQVYNLKNKHLLSPQEIKQRLIDLKKPNELTTAPIKLDTGNVPTAEVLESYPKIFNNILKSWNKQPTTVPAPASKNLQTSEVLYEKIRKKALRMQHLKNKLDQTNISSKTCDITIIGDGHNAKLAADFENSLANIFPELTIKAINAKDFAKDPKKYAKLIDADTINITLSHTGRRTPTYEVAKHLKWLEDQAGGTHSEGGVFAISSRWDTELAMLVGTSPAENKFTPRVISTFSGRSFANPILHAPSFLLTLLEMQNYLAQRLRQDADTNPDLYGKYPLGMKATSQMLSQTHDIGRQIMHNTGDILSPSKNKNNINKRLDKVGKKFSAYSHESLRVFVVAAGLVALSIWLSLPLPFDLIYQFILLPAFPVLGTWSFQGVLVAEVFIRFLNIFFWEFSFFYVLWIVRFVLGHPVNLPKNGISKIYLQNKKDIGSGLVADFAQEVIDSNWLLRQFKDAKTVGQEDKISTASLMLSSTPLNIPKSPPSKTNFSGSSPKKIRRKRFRIKNKNPERFGFGNELEAQKQEKSHMLGYEEFDFYRKIQNQLNKIGPGLSGQSKKIVDSYDSLFRGMGYYSVLGSMDRHARSQGHWLASPITAFKAWLVSKVRKTHMRYPVGRPEPGLVSLLKILVTGTLGYSIIKGVLKQTLFAQATPAVLTLFLCFIGATLVLVPLLTWIKKELKFFHRFFIKALMPPDTQKMKSSYQAPDTDYSEIKRVLKKYSLKSRVKPNKKTIAPNETDNGTTNTQKSVPEETVSTTIAYMVRNGVEEATDILETMLARLQTTTDLDFNIEDLKLMVALRHEAQNGDKDLADAIIVEMTVKIISQKGHPDEIKAQAITLLNGSADKLIEQNKIADVLKLFKALVQASETTNLAAPIIEHIWNSIPSQNIPEFKNFLLHISKSSTINANHIANKLLRFSAPETKIKLNAKNTNKSHKPAAAPKKAPPLFDNITNPLAAKLFANPFSKILPGQILKELAINSASFTPKDLIVLEKLARSGSLPNKEEATAIVTRIETLRLLQPDTDNEHRKKAVYHLGAILESVLLAPIGYSNVDTRNIFGILLESIRYTPEAKPYLERFVKQHHANTSFDIDRYLLDYLLDPSVFPAVKLQAIKLLQADENQQFEMLRVLEKQFDFFNQTHKVESVRKIALVLSKPHNEQIRTKAIELLIKWLSAYNQPQPVKRECILSLKTGLDNSHAKNALLDQLALFNSKPLVEASIESATAYLQNPNNKMPYKLSDLLTQTLDSKDPAIRVKVIQAMQYKSSTPLSTFLLDVNGYLYESFLSHPSHNPTFSELFEIIALEDPTPKVQAAAIRALVYSKNHRSAKLCAEKILKTEQNIHLRLAALEAIASINTQNADMSNITHTLQQAVDELEKASVEKDENLRLQAVKTTSFLIKTIDGKGGRSLLKLRNILDKLFEDRNMSVATAATAAYTDLAMYTEKTQANNLIRPLLEKTLIKSVFSKHRNILLKQSCATQAGQILSNMSVGKNRNEIVRDIISKTIDHHTSAQTLGLLITMLRPARIQKAYPMAKTLVSAYDTIKPVVEFGWANMFAGNPDAQIYKNIFMQNVYPAIFMAVMNNPEKSLVNLKNYIEQILNQAADKITLEVNSSTLDIAA